ncbi:MAG: FHA domain-containing protein, partial [Anaerolineae bacterium]|nr:FHA domain-containing protein [Anaerolineae bacterium]
MIDPIYQNEPILIVEETQQIFPLSQDLVTIGRKSGNTIVLGNDLRVSRHHATIQWRGGHYFIRDVGSSNGTFVNGVQISELRQLESGDKIEVGDTTFRIKLPLDETEPRLSQSGQPAVPAPARLERQQTDHTVMRVNTPPPSTNPYVGPRTFSQEESDRFFGRETEARELLSLVISERLVLFYAQSGAGKSSLINTRLVPQLRQANLPVLPIGRVSGELPEAVEAVDNIYIFNLLLSMDESDGNPKRFTRMTLSDFLVNLTSLDGTHYYYDDTTETNEIDPNDLEEEELYEESP